MGGQIDMGAYEFPFPPRTFYVDADATGPITAQTGQMHSGLFRTHFIIRTSSRVIEICVAEGVYRPDRGAGAMLGYKQSAFRLALGVFMEGGYAGFGAADPNSATWSCIKRF